MSKTWPFACALLLALVFAFQNCGRFAALDGLTGLTTASTAAGGTAADGTAGGASGGAVGGTTQAAPFGLKVSGRQFVSTVDGSPVQLLGVSISGLEQGHTALDAAGYLKAADPGFALMAAMNINLVRIPLNEATWLGLQNGSCGTDTGTVATLQNTVRQTVANANAKGLYVILDLHWSAPTAFGCPVGQASMADADNATAFWTSVAAIFKNNPAVMFEIFNEPFAAYNYNSATAAIGSTPPAGQSATDLSLLQNGGTYSTGFWYECNGGGKPCPSGQTQGGHYLNSNVAPFKAEGMQEMLNAIRATGATNVVISNSMWFAGEIETWLSAKPIDSLSQLAAGWHEDGGGSATTVAAEAILAAGYPVVITEGYPNSAQTQAVTQAYDPAGTNYFTWATANKVGFSFWAWVPPNWNAHVLECADSSCTSHVLGTVGQTLKTAYCAQSQANALANCR